MVATKFLRQLAAKITNAVANIKAKFSISKAIAEQIVYSRATPKGELSSLALGVVVAIVALFIGLYMISMVSEVAAINNTSDFYSTFSNLVTKTGTIYNVLILVIIITALGVAIWVLKGFGGTRTSPEAAV